jgi:hypothetical protein
MRRINTARIIGDALSQQMPTYQWNRLQQLIGRSSIRTLLAWRAGERLPAQVYAAIVVWRVPGDASSYDFYQRCSDHILELRALHAHEGTGKQMPEPPDTRCASASLFALPPPNPPLLLAVRYEVG